MMEGTMRAEIKKIYAWYSEACKNAAEKAKSEGKWKEGLDMNRHLFEPLRLERERKMRELVSRMEGEHGHS